MAACVPGNKMVETRFYALENSSKLQFSKRILPLFQDPQSIYITTFKRINQVNSPARMLNIIQVAKLGNFTVIKLFMNAISPSLI